MIIIKYQWSIPDKKFLYADVTNLMGIFWCRLFITAYMLLWISI